VPKGKPTDYYDKTRQGLGYVTPPAQSQSEGGESLPSYSSRSSEWESDVSVGVSSKTSSSIWLQSINWSKRRLFKHFTLSHGPSNSISSERSDLNNVNRPMRIG